MLNFDDSELDEFINNIDSTVKNDSSLVDKWKTILYVDANLLSFLKMNIGSEVYGQGTDNPDAVAVDPNSSDPSPNEMYHRTGDLMRSARLKMTDRGLVLYMDDDWLGNQPQASLSATEQIGEGFSWMDEYGEILPSFGEAQDAHQGDGYAVDVEEGRTFTNQNILGTFQAEIPPRPYMKVTFQKLPKQLDKMNKEKIVDILISEITG